MVHSALDKVIALHAVFVGGQVGVLVEVGYAGFKLFQLPVVGETVAGGSPPASRSSLPSIASVSSAAALDCGTGCRCRCRGRSRVLRGSRCWAAWVCDVLAARTMALFAAYVPLGDLFCFDVVIHAVAAVAEGPVGRSMLWAVEGHPPVGICLDVIGSQRFFATSHWAGRAK